MDWLMSNAVKLVCVCVGGGGGGFFFQKRAFKSTVLTGLSLVDGGRHA